jgi:hypothetical protein
VSRRDISGSDLYLRLDRQSGSPLSLLFRHGCEELSRFTTVPSLTPDFGHYPAGEICLARGRHVLLPTKGIVSDLNGRPTPLGSVFLLMGGGGHGGTSF